MEEYKTLGGSSINAKGPRFPSKKTNMRKSIMKAVLETDSDLEKE
jgi:hypothetical protein